MNSTGASTTGQQGFRGSQGSSQGEGLYDQAAEAARNVYEEGGRYLREGWESPIPVVPLSQSCNVAV